MEDLAEVVARRDLGDLAFERGSFNTAIKYYMRAITRHPRGPWAFWHIASAKFQQGDFEETIRFCTLAGDQVPQVNIEVDMLFFRFLVSIYILFYQRPHHFRPLS